jgi:hypothetical protein
MYLISNNFSGKAFKKHAVNYNEALMQSNFENLGSHRLVYAVVNLHNQKYCSSFGIM